MVISRVINALARALLMAIFVAFPSLLLPGIGSDGATIMLFVCLFSGVFVFVEYVSRYPSIIEFRDAAPYNRMRFFMGMMLIVVLSLLSMSATSTGPAPTIVGNSAALIGGLLDVPLSPVRLLLIAMPPDADLAVLFALRDGAAIAYAISIVGVVAFVLLVRWYDWPARNGAFNVWVNLPLFDPTTGGDVVPRLRRDGYINIIAGVLLPFILPALAALAGSMFDVLALLEGQSFVWSVAAWSFIPASMIMRGVAICRIAELIEEKRERTYARAAAEAGY